VAAAAVNSVRWGLHTLELHMLELHMLELHMPEYRNQSVTGISQESVSLNR
jgi:hypothetical protein